MSETYLHRHAEGTIGKLSRMFGAVLVAGPRQVGKTTMLRQLTSGVHYVTLDDTIVRAAAMETGNTFFKDHTPPVFVDEIQKAPNLFEQMKLILDESGKKGQFFLSGSQQFRVMKGVSESLAGRIGLITLLGLSLREIHGVADTSPFLPTSEYLESRRAYLAPVSYDEVWYTIWRGTMPELLLNEDFDWQMYYAAYVRTYLERDVRELVNIGDEIKFMQFMTACAAMTGQLLNLSSLSRDVGISQPAAGRWLSVLTASGIVYLLRPYSNNITKRAVKTPKIYFLDTGLAAYLTKWNTPGVLKNGAMSGRFFESFVVSEIVKSYCNRGFLEPPLYFYRDKDKKEIDVIISDNGTLYPIEIKKHADPSKSDTASFSVIDSIPGVKRGEGGVVCFYDSLISLSSQDKVIPVRFL